MKTTFFNRYEDSVWPPQCHNFDSTAGAGGFTAGAAAPAVNMLEEALQSAQSRTRSPEIAFLRSLKIVQLIGNTRTESH